MTFTRKLLSGVLTTGYSSCLSVMFEELMLKNGSCQALIAGPRWYAARYQGNLGEYIGAVPLKFVRAGCIFPVQSAPFQSSRAAFS